MTKIKKHTSKVFFGDSAVSEFLTPGALGMAPLVELPESVNLFKKDKVRIFIKLMQAVPLGNVKSLPAWMMLNNISAEKKKSIQHLVEYSSGNTVLSLTILSRLCGIPNMHAIITPDVPEHKKRLLRLVGTELIISHGPPSPDALASVGGIYDAKILGKKTGWHNLNQYINPGNPKASEEYIGKELWKQLGLQMTIFVSSIGTAGTIVGAGSYLKKKNKNIYVAGACIKRGSSIPGPRGEDAIPKLGIDWSKVVDKTIAMETRSAYEQSLKLIRLGFFVGPSTGMQLAMALKLLGEMKKNGTLPKYRNKDGEVVVSFIACDTMFAYVDDYFSVLPKKYFKSDRDLGKK